VQYIFFHLFNQFLSLNLNCISYRQHMVGFYFSIQSDNPPFSATFRPLLLSLIFNLKNVEVRTVNLCAVENLHIHFHSPKM
jgi:hypothetical protein